MFTPIANWNFIDEAPEPGLTYGRFAAVRGAGTNERAAWSNDGITWNAATTPNSYDYFGIDFSPELGLYVAVGAASQTNNIMTSTNSVTWTARSKPDNEILRGATWCSDWGKFFVTAATKIYESSDGITWTIAYTFSTAGYGSYGFEYPFADTPSGRVWVCTLTPNTGSNKMRLCYSTNGSTFTEADTTSDTFWTIADGRAIIYSPELNRFCIFSQTTSNRILTSTDVTSGWSFYTQSVTPVGFGLRIGAGWGNGLFVSPLFTNSAALITVPIQYSSLGTEGSWTASTFPNANYQFYDAEYAPEINTWFVCRTNASNGFSSNDGITWTQRTTTGNTYYHASWGPGVRTNGYKQGAGIT